MDVDAPRKYKKITAQPQKAVKYSLRSYLQETIYFLDILNNLCIWFRFLTRYIHYSMYLKSQLSLVNKTGGSSNKQ